MSAGLVLDQGDWLRLRVTGDDRVRFLQGMLTADVAKLAPGGALQAALLNVKGRVLAVVDVVAEPDALWVLAAPELADKVHQLLERHAIADDVTFTRVPGPLHRVWLDATSPWTAPPVLAAPPAPAAAAEAVEVLRVEAGYPRYGVDVTEEHFPFEAHLEAMLSSTKGCYIGQEVVVRGTVRGGANRRLVGLRLGDGPVPARGAPVAAAERTEAGVVTSAVRSPRLGTLALAYLL